MHVQVPLDANDIDTILHALSLETESTIKNSSVHKLVLFFRTQWGLLGDLTENARESYEPAGAQIQNLINTVNNPDNLDTFSLKGCHCANNACTWPGSAFCLNA